MFVERSHKTIKSLKTLFSCKIVKTFNQYRINECKGYVNEERANNLGEKISEIPRLNISFYLFSRIEYVQHLSK